MPRSTTATAEPDTDDHANLVTATQVGRNFGRFCDEALRHPVTVERHGAPRIVMLSLHEYRRLRALEPLLGEIPIMRKFALLAVVAATFAISACNTLSGAGRDVSAAGSAVTNTAEDAKQ